MTILQNAYTQNLTETEFIAVNAQGTPIGRASNREALERAHADLAVTILSASEAAAEPTLAEAAAEPSLAEAATSKLDGPFAAIVAQGVGAEQDDPNLEPPAEEKPKADPFDHDGDGHSGGSKKGAESTAAKGAAKKTATKK